MPKSILFELPAFLLGLLFGSFLNVCISRLPEHRSISKPRSHCPHCGETIRWYDNVPVLSWLLLRSKCRHCSAVISWRYPAVELAVGCWFWFVGTGLSHLVNSVSRLDGLRNELQYSGNVQPISMESLLPPAVAVAMALAILGFLLIGLLVMDWQTHRLPDAFTLTGILIGFVLVCVQGVFLPAGIGDIKFDPQHSLRLSSPGSFVAKGNVFMTGPEHLVLGRLFAIVAAGSLLLIVRAVYKAARRREGVGLGDAKLLAMIAAFLGFWPAMLALFAGVVAAAVYSVTLLARSRASATTRIPLGSFLAAGGLLSALVGAPLLAWYSSLL